MQLLANYSPKNCFFIEKTKLKNAKYSVANIDELPTFIIIDDQQLLLLIRASTGKKRVAALWTNYDAFVKVLKTLFLQLWTKNN